MTTPKTVAKKTASEVPSDFVDHPLAFIGGVYRARVTNVHDGDTLSVTIDPGFNDYPFRQVRVVGINAPELATPSGKSAAAALSQLALGAPCRVETAGAKDKYGRYLARVVLVVPSVVTPGHLDEIDVGPWMIAHGYAVAWDGTGPKPVPAPAPATRAAGGPTTL